MRTLVSRCNHDHNIGSSCSCCSSSYNENRRTRDQRRRRIYHEDINIRDFAHIILNFRVFDISSRPKCGDFHIL